MPLALVFYIMFNSMKSRITVHSGNPFGGQHEETTRHRVARLIAIAYRDVMYQSADDDHPVTRREYNPTRWQSDHHSNHRG